MVDQVQPAQCSKNQQLLERLRTDIDRAKKLTIFEKAKAAEDLLGVAVELLGELVDQVNRIEAQLETQGEAIDQLIEDHHEQTDRTH